LSGHTIAKCPNCGDIVAATFAFCSDCGQDLDGVGGEVSTDGSTVTATSSSDKNMYYLGVVLGILGVVFFGYFFPHRPTGSGAPAVLGAECPR
jgi:uncharacterized OB-fold protein